MRVEGLSFSGLISCFLLPLLNLTGHVISLNLELKPLIQYRCPWGVQGGAYTTCIILSSLWLCALWLFALWAEAFAWQLHWGGLHI